MKSLSDGIHNTNQRYHKADEHDSDEYHQNTCEKRFDSIGNTAYALFDAYLEI